MSSLFVLNGKESKLLRFLKSHIVSCVFLLGFVFDIFILPDVEHFLTVILGTSYITFFSICLFWRELIIKNNKVDDEEKDTYRILTFLISFFSGSSLSYIFTYSLRSADFGLSAPLLIIFFIVLIANEVVGTHRFRLIFDYTLLIIVSSFYNIYMMPLLTGSFDDRTFYISIFSSALIIYFYTSFFSSYSEFGHIIKPKGNALAFTVPLAAFFLVLNFLLPPVPFTIEKIIVTSKNVSLEKDKTFLAKVVSFREGKNISLSFSEDSSVTYTTVYALPAHVESSPRHLWYKKQSEGVYLPVETLEIQENKVGIKRSLTSSIRGSLGDYKVITSVGVRTLREDTLTLR